MCQFQLDPVLDNYVSSRLTIRSGSSLGSALLLADETFRSGRRACSLETAPFVDCRHYLSIALRINEFIRTDADMKGFL